MKKTSTLLTLLFTGSTLFSAEESGEKITYADHVLPILENKCVNCHNADEAKGGLNLATYSATLTGGSGGEIVTSEDPGSSRLFTLSAHTEEPFMPPKGTKATAKELKILSDWIAGGLLETTASKARKSNKPKVDLNSITSTGKPEGPPAMPEHLLLEPEVITDRPNSVPAMAHSPWAPILAVAGQKQVLLFHSKDFDLLGVLPYPEGFPQTLSFSPNGAYLSCGGGRAGKSGNVVAWDIKTGERILNVGKEYDIVLGADVSPDLKNAILGGPKRNIKLWNTVSGEEVNSIKKHPDWLLTAAYSPDGVIFATGGRNAGLYVWEAATGYEFYTLKGHTKAVTDIDWRADGNLLASCSEDGQIILWEMQEGKQVKKWNAHTGGALAVTFSPDGRLASVGRDKTVKIWQADGKQLRSIPASDDIVLSVAFSHDNKRVFSGDWHGVVKVWDVESGAELAKIEPNPPTIEQQLAYSEKKISELTGALPALEKGIDVVSKEMSDARNALAAVDNSIREATTTRDTSKAAADKLTNSAKALAAQLELAKKLIATRQAETKKYTDALQVATQAKTTTQAAATKEEAAFKASEAAFNTTKAAVAKATAESKIPALSAEQKKKYDELAAIRNAAVTEKQRVDAAFSASAKLLADGQQSKAAIDKELADREAGVTTATADLKTKQVALDTAQKALAAAEAALAGALKKSPTPPQELVNRKNQAAQAKAATEGARNQSNQFLQQATAALNATTAKHIAATANLTKVTADTNQLKLTQAEAGKKLAAADAAWKPLQDALVAGNARLEKTKATLASATTANQTADKAYQASRTRRDAANQTLAAAQGKEKASQEAVAKANAEQKKAQDAFAAKQTELNTNNTQLAASNASLKKAEETLAAATKKKEGAKAKVDTIAKKEADTKKQIEVAKAELDTSKFLVKKWQAAAINLTAHQETEELDGMTEELEDMMEEEEEAKSDVAEATEARAEAEKTLAVAQSTVAEGTKTLMEKSTSVLESALQLVSSRAVAELREEAVLLQPTAAEKNPSDNTPITVNSDPIVSDLGIGDFPTEDLLASSEDDSEKEKEVIETVAAQALSYKSPDEISAEVLSLRKRLSGIEQFLSTTYTEADRTKETVEKANQVAKTTPKVIAERSTAEQEAARELAEAEAERKRQEYALVAQQKRIEELRAKYLETLPERKE